MRTNIASRYFYDLLESSYETYNSTTDPEATLIIHIALLDATLPIITNILSCIEFIAMTILNLIGTISNNQMFTIQDAFFNASNVLVNISLIPLNLIFVPFVLFYKIVTLKAFSKDFQRSFYFNNRTISTITELRAQLQQERRV